MSVFGTVTDLMNETAWQQAQDAANVDRKVGGDMGKNDFLMLLSAQLRFQDPLNPQNDADFASQLAQFSSLEQMQNMNTTLSQMTSFQSYSLVGKYVIAEALVNGVMSEIPGVVDSIYTEKGITYAQIGEFTVPISSIKEVFNTDNMLTAEMLMQTSSNLIGRTVIAQVGKEDFEGVVTRVLVDKGALIAQIDDGTGEPKFVPVNAIVDIRETGTRALTPKPETPPKAINFKPDGKGGFIEMCKDFIQELGLWTWDSEKWEWVYKEYGKETEEYPSAA